MATATESSSSASSPHSPRFRQGSRGLSCPWSHVVRGMPEGAATPSSRSPLSPSAIPPPEPSDRSPLTAAASDAADVSAPPLPSDGASEGDGGKAVAAQGKKAAWSRPPNGAIEAGAVMGAASWPALSEAAKAFPKSSPSDPAKGLSDGSGSASPAPLITSSPPGEITNDTDGSSSTKNGSPTRQRSMKRGGSTSSGGAITDESGGAPANDGQVPPSFLPTSSEVPKDALDRPVTLRPPFRESNHGNSTNWDHGSRGGGCSPQSQVGNEHHRNYGSNRRGNNGGGGGAPYHNNFVNRRGLGRGSYDWNNRSFSGGRDVQLQQQQQQQPRTMARPFLQPLPSGSTPFISPPPPVRPFASPVGYYDFPSPIFYVPTHPPPESHGGMPFVGPPAMFYAAPDSQLRAMLGKQIDYYFSPENLCKDIYLRQNMDEEGWVSISLIASFNRVRNLTNNVQFILDTVKTSTVVEVQGDKIRRRNDWVNWPPLAPASNPPHPSAIPSCETLAAHAENVKLEEGSSSHNSMRGAIFNNFILTRSSSGLSSQLPEVIASTGSWSDPVLACPDQSVLARNLVQCDTF